MTDTPPQLDTPRPAESTAESAAPESSGKSGYRAHIAFFGSGALCFAFLYWRLDAAADREGLALGVYLARELANVEWLPWMVLMMGYSAFYLCIDTLVITRALNWFLRPVRYRDILPVRASAYVVSLINEQIGKGAMAFYLYRRDRTPSAEVAAVMLFVMFCEVFYLLFWATVGYAVSGSRLPAAFGLIPWIAAAASPLLGLWLAFFQGEILPRARVREQRLLRAFRRAEIRHYLLFLALRSPALLAAVVVYTTALGLFGVEASLLEMLGYLPVIFFAAAVPTPMRAAAIASWVILFPENTGAMAAFGFLQHNFFILFNALIGVLFWPRAKRDLFG